MAISEQLQQRINNLTQGMGEINPPSRPISNQEMEIIRQTDPMAGRMGSADSGFYTDAPIAQFTEREAERLDDQIRATGFFQDVDLSQLAPNQKLELLQGAQRIQEANQQQSMMETLPFNPNSPMPEYNPREKNMIGEDTGMLRKANSSPTIQQQLMMARDAVKPMGAQFTEGEAERLSTAAFGDPINETQQAIDSLTQELQMTTDPEEAEGLGRMINKLQAQINAPMGAMAQELAKVGGGEDTALAHLRPGEIVLPPEMMEDPRFEKMVEDKFKGLGIDPAQAVVGMGIASLNESTGLEEFGFFKKLGKKLGKVVKKVAPIAMMFPGVGTALGGALGGLGGLATKGLAKVGLGGLGSALGGLGSSAMGMVANAGIPGLSSIAGGTAQSFGGIKGGLGSLKGLLGDGPLSGLLGGGQQPSIDELGKADGSTQVRIDRLRSEGMSDAQIMQNLQQSGMAPQASGGRSIFGGGTPGQSRIGMIEDMLKNRPSDPVREGGGMFGGGGNQGGGMFGGGGQGGGLGALGTAGLLGLAGSLGKMAYDETKNDSGVPLTPLNTMNAAGRFNMEAEIARRMGQQAPNPVEFGLLPQDNFPELSGGQAVPKGMMMGGEVMMPMGYAQGGAFPNKGLEALNKVAPQVVDQMGYNMGGQVMPMGYNMGGRPMMPMQYAEGGNVSMEEFERQNGMINGEGTETSDDVPAMLSDGEFVMTGQAVRGAGSYELQQGDGGILNLIPSLDEDRERGTELLYNMMEVFGNRANAS
eukprot:GHVR01081716.1.p1 GENE.GHVR01081716.1~~GHVR01081716.1.p1  ORF type:complete len:758 (+),score=184.62 GHVR01081716.1:151-2424(+)